LPKLAAFVERTILPPLIADARDCRAIKSAQRRIARYFYHNIEQDAFAVKLTPKADGGRNGEIVDDFAADLGTAENTIR
jgi:hypothetical protein